MSRRLSMGILQRVIVLMSSLFALSACAGGAAAAGDAPTAASSSAGFIFWTEVTNYGHTSLHRGKLNSDGTSIRGIDEIPLAHGGLVSLSGLATDPGEDTIYWTLGTQREVWRLPSASTGVTPEKLEIAFPPGPTGEFFGIACDTETNHLYVAEQQANRIWRIDLGASPCTAAVFATPTAPSALAIDPVSRNLYWGVVDDKATLRLVQRAPLAGPVGAGLPVQTLTTVAAGWERPVSGVAVDPANGIVYFLEQGQEPLFKAHFNQGLGTAYAADRADEVPSGLWFDPALNRTYWGSEASRSRLWTSKMGSGGFAGAPVALLKPKEGLAIGRVAVLSKRPAAPAISPWRNQAPLGTIEAFAGPLAQVPLGWLPCDGRELPKTHPLYSVIGDTWGATGDRFHLPKLDDGRFLRSATASNPAGALQGDATRLNVGRSPKWTTAREGDHDHGGFNGVVLGSPDPTKGTEDDDEYRAFQAGTHRRFDGGAGARHDHALPDGDAETRPMNAAVLWIIRVESD